LIQLLPLGNESLFVYSRHGYLGVRPEKIMLFASSRLLRVVMPDQTTEGGKRRKDLPFLLSPNSRRMIVTQGGGYKQAEGHVRANTQFAHNPS
jgi:hypothetical protein